MDRSSVWPVLTKRENRETPRNAGSRSPCDERGRTDVTDNSSGYRITEMAEGRGAAYLHLRNRDNLVVRNNYAHELSLK